MVKPKCVITLDEKGNIKSIGGICKKKEFKSQIEFLKKTLKKTKR